jgi:bla regulator protein blaR1
MLCILYVIALSTLLSLAGVLAEQALPVRWPRRWIWFVAIASAVVVPPIYRANHSTTLANAAESSVHSSHGTHASAGAPSALLDAEWWAHVESYDSVIERLWLLASAGLVLWGLANAGWVWHVLHRSRRGRGDRRSPTVVDGVPVVVTDSLGPATVGVLRSRVVVPRWVLALPGAQRRYVLRHEEEHRRAHDALVLFVASLALILTPWNLALWWQIRRLALAIEMDCDQRVVSALGDPTAYGTLLLRVAEAASRGPRLQPALLGRVGMVEQRLTLLVSSVPRGRVMRVLTPLMACAILLAALSMPHPVLAPASSERSASGARP